MDAGKIKSRARNNAYSLLRSRPRSEFEIRERLKNKGYNQPLIDDLVEELRRAGQIDDERFAKLWVESRMHANPKGDVVLRQELKEKGLSQSVIEATLADKRQRYDEYEVAFDMARERFGRFKKLDRRKASKRVYDFLVRRGFGFDTISKIIDTIVGHP